MRVPSGLNEHDFRPYPTYGQIRMKTHMLSQHYHSLQMTANRQTGRVNYSAAYTFSKALGVAGAFYGSVTDSFDLRRRSYGVLPFDRTQTFSIAYNLLLPDPAQSPVLREILNGWQVSGITQFQSGAPFNPGMSGSTSVRNYDDTDWIGVGSNTAINGTPDSPARLWVTCDPRQGLEKGQYANPNCFAPPLPGQNGMYQYPYMKTPAFQNHDLSIFKNFQVGQSEDQKVQLRFSGYNFLNHPIPIFAGGEAVTRLEFEQGQMTTVSADRFAKPITKRGRRLMQFAIKYMF
jgi:hypothetical protein